MSIGDDLYLITGASGKTGAKTVEVLRERGASVRATAGYFCYPVTKRKAMPPSSIGWEGDCWTVPR